MAVIRRSTGESPGADSDSCVIVKPEGLTIGDLMKAHIVGRGAGAEGFTAPEGWTFIREDVISAAIDCVSALFWKIADAADVAASDFTFTATNSASNRGAITAWTGHNPASPINAHSGQTNEASTTVTAPTITPAVANCVICMIGFVINDRTFSSYAITDDNPASWSEAYDLPSNLAYDLGLALGYATRPETSATGNGTATITVATINIGQLVAIAPAVEGEAHEKSLSDTVAIADSISKSFGAIKVDSVGLADAISKEPQLAKADSIALADALTKGVGLFKTDTVTIADTFTRVVDFIRTFSDTVSISDAIGKAISIIKSDTMAITDSMIAVIGGVAHVLNLFDTVTITDSIAGVLRVKTYLRRQVSRMNIQRLNVSRMPLFRYITRRFP